MPTYHYIAIKPEEGCPRCRRGFDLRRPLDRPPLTACPICKRPVQKVVQRVNTPRVSRKPSVSEARSAGFTVLEKRADGSYEKL